MNYKSISLIIPTSPVPVWKCIISYPPVSKASREVANFIWRKIHPPTHMLRLKSRFNSMTIWPIRAEHPPISDQWHPPPPLEALLGAILLLRLNRVSENLQGVRKGMRKFLRKFPPKFSKNKFVKVLTKLRIKSGLFNCV